MSAVCREVETRVLGQPQKKVVACPQSHPKPEICMVGSSPPILCDASCLPRAEALRWACGIKVRLWRPRACPSWSVDFCMSAKTSPSLSRHHRHASSSRRMGSSRCCRASTSRRGLVRCKKQETSAPQPSDRRTPTKVRSLRQVSPSRHPMYMSMKAGAMIQIWDASLVHCPTTPKTLDSRPHISPQKNLCHTTVRRLCVLQPLRLR